MDSDFDLIDRSVAGDEQAFAELVGRYQSRLLTALVHILGSRSDAEDVLQEAFWNAYRNLDGFQRNSSFYTWLYRIAFNLAVTFQRRQRGELSVEELRRIGAVEPAEPDADVTAPLERAEEVARVRAALERLSTEFRTALILRDLEGCCYETIAEITGVPIGTVRSRIHRARAQLREILLQEMKERPE
ncbi:MAG: RNA polymerase sigma factor [Pirellulaceae bacterium]|nr:MAG: RNA polymerase sigma factor [Pirellulaceae bacterium]